MVDKTFCDTCGSEVNPINKKTLTINHYYEETPTTEDKEDTSPPTDNKDRIYTLCPNCLTAIQDYVDQYVKTQLTINKKKQMINELMTTINKKIDLMEKLE